jgi:hypothetical protein
MSEYNIDKATGVSQEINQVPAPKKPQYLTAFLAGLGVSVVVAIALAAIGIWLESEFILVLIIGAVLVGIVIHKFVPNKSIGGAILGAILCPATYFMYQIFMAMFGYYYEDGDSTFWLMLAGSFVYGAYMGYNNDND